MRVLETARALALPDWLLFSGAVYQTLWNARTNRAPDYGIKDFDLAYFDSSDLSWEAEDAVIRRVATAFDPPLRALVETRNQARVHLWFEQRFGAAYAPLRSAAEALTRFVAPAFAIGVRLEDDHRLNLVAPFGLDDVFRLRIRPNPHRRSDPARFQQIALGLQERWPELTILAR
ncbi:MAG TPA: nucleotidyltransferase family protein [Caulobacteraceae bacterium]|nr:nucleotidyltransferase family protein [Caulobacteraceae bacterium]